MNPKSISPFSGVNPLHLASLKLPIGLTTEEWIRSLYANGDVFADGTQVWEAVEKIADSAVERSESYLKEEVRKISGQADSLRIHNADLSQKIVNLSSSVEKYRLAATKLEIEMMRFLIESGVPESEAKHHITTLTE